MYMSYNVLYYNVVYIYEILNLLFIGCFELFFFRYKLYNRNIDIYIYYS